MKNRKYYRSYSEAMKKLNLIVAETNRNTGNEYEIPLIGEQPEVKKKFVLKTAKKSEPTPDMSAPDMGAPAPETPAPDMGAPAPDMGGESDMGAPAPDMGGEPDMGMSPEMGGEEMPEEPEMPMAPGDAPMLDTETGLETYSIDQKEIRKRLSIGFTKLSKNDKIEKFLRQDNIDAVSVFTLTNRILDIISQAGFDIETIAEYRKLTTYLETKDKSTSILRDIAKGVLYELLEKISKDNQTEINDKL
jgi:hypothetical protein